MSIFNPEPPKTNDPNYLGWSKPIGQPESDKSGAYSWKAAGDVLEEGIKTADTVVKHVIDDQVHESVDPVRDQFTSALKSTTDALRGSRGSLLDTPSTTAAPPVLQNLPDSLKSLATARGNGRLSETDYIGRLDTMAKDFRARYPGYRDYIDNKFQEATGIPMANGYIKALLSDLNSITAKKDSEKDKLRNELITDSYPGSEIIVKQLDNNQITNYDAIKWLTTNRGMKNQWKLEDAGFEHVKNVREADALSYEDTSSTRASLLASQSINNMFAASGTKIVDLLKQSGFQGSEGARLSDEQWAGLVSTVTTNKVAARAQIEQFLNSPNENGVSRASLLGPTKTKAIIDNSLAMHDLTLDAINNKDHGLAFRNLHLGTAFTQDYFNQTLQSPDMRAIAGPLSFIQRISPNGFKDAFDRIAGDSSLTQGAKDFMTQQKTKQLTYRPSDPRPTWMQPNEPNPTMKSLLDKAQSTPSLNNPATYKAATDMPEDVLNPKLDPKLRVNQAHATFDPVNIDNISKFKPEQQMGIFSKWTKPDMTTEVKKLSDAYDPKLWTNYQTFAERNFARLFHTEIQDLGHYTDMQNVNVRFNPSTNHFEAIIQRGNNVPKQGGLGLDTRDPRTVLPQVQESLSRLNQGLDSMAVVAKTAGYPIQEYLAKSLVQFGARVDNINDPAGAFFQAVGGVKAMQYTDEYSDTSKLERGSLKDFLANPSGSKTLEKPKAITNYADMITGPAEDIPEGMSARDFVKKLKAEGKF